jgi:LysR family hydrogen peroxide-inducible transcriptional activator
MTLTELRYLVTLAQERHFGRAAERCHVAQPTLSVAIRKLEESLNLSIFERHRHGVLVTPAGEAVIAQAQVVLNEAETLTHLANQARDEFAEPLRVGAIFTLGPYLFPALIRQLRASASPLKLYLEENYTHVLDQQLANGDLDAILVALPFEPPETRVVALFEEPFSLLMSAQHPWAKRRSITSSEVSNSPLLMLGEGHCFRDQVLETCALSSAAGSIRTGSSLMTLRHMVANGLGSTFIPAIAEPYLVDDDVISRPLKPAPMRQIVLASRYRFPRRRALEALTQALQSLQLPGAVRLT